MTPDDPTAEGDPMDFDEAIKAHAAWKMRLSQYLANPDGSLDPRVVGRSDLCPLGQWIAGEGRGSAGSPIFATLVEQHPAFHQAAADIVRRADAGEDVRAEVALGGQSAFASASMTLVAAIMKLKTQVAA